MLSQEEKFLVMLNHASRELLQIMVAAKMSLDNNEELGLEAEQLKDTLDSTWQTIGKQINDVSRYLKIEEDPHLPDSFPRTSHEESTWTISSLIKRRSRANLEK